MSTAKQTKAQVTIGSETLKALINLTHAVSEDVTRFHLMSVHIKNGRAIATDGHIAAWYDSKELEGMTVGVPRTALEAFKRAKSSVVTFDTASMTATDGAHTVKLEEYSTSADHIANSFAKPYNVGETRESKIQKTFTTIAFNPLLLSRIGKALGIKKHHGLKLVIKTPSDPIQVYSESEFRAVLMPMRL